MACGLRINKLTAWGEFKLWKRERKEKVKVGSSFPQNFKGSKPSKSIWDALNHAP